MGLAATGTCDFTSTIQLILQTTSANGHNFVFPNVGVGTYYHTSELTVIERLPGWHGRYFHSSNMTFAHYDFVSGASIHEHFHPEEEVYEVIEGELEITIDGETRRMLPGLARHRSIQAAADSGAVVSAGTGSAIGGAAYGLGSLTVESVRMVQNFSF